MILSDYKISTNKKIIGKKKLTIALVSDLHEGDPTEVIALLRKEKPDIICIAGDTFERYGTGDDPQMKENASPLHRFLHNLLLRLKSIIYIAVGSRTIRNTAQAYCFIKEIGEMVNQEGEKSIVYLSFGNHEWRLDKEDEQILNQAGVNILDNSYVFNEKYGICFGGLSPRVDLTWLDDYCKQDGYKILLCHHPEYYKKYLKGKGIELVLSGHAHGGQIRIFHKGLFAPGQGILPKYTKGLYDGHLLVSAGCKNTASIPRLGNPCEIVRITLEGAEDSVQID